MFRSSGAFKQRSAFISLSVPSVIVIVYAGVALYFILSYSFNWPKGDDFSFIANYIDFKAGKETLGGLISTYNGPHPMGAQMLLTLVIYSLFGLSIVKTIILSSVLIVLSSLLFWLCIRSSCESHVTSHIVLALALAMSFHPVQTNHLTWAFEIGWFIVNLLLIASLTCLERFRSRGFLPAYLMLLVATFCSAQAVVLWLCAFIQVCLLPDFRNRKLAASALALGLLANAVAILHIAPTSEAPSGSIATFAIYYVDILGSFFSVRDTFVLGCTGAATVAISAATVVTAIFKGSTTPISRMSLLLITASLGFVAIFTKGRYQNGLPWALSSFHAGPLLVPMLLGFILVGVRCWQSPHHRWQARIGSVTIVTFLAASVVSSLPYMKEKGAETLTKQAFAMHVACNPGYSDYVVANLNIDESWYSLFRRVKPYLKPLCTSDEPLIAQALNQMPPLFEQMMAANPSSRNALTSLWEIYITHFDLQRAFPISRIGDLLRFANNNAINGSQYEPEQLKPYEEYFRGLK